MLDNYRDSNRVIRVGGWLQLVNVTGQCIHPAVLPRDSPITKLVVRYYHERVHHMGGVWERQIRTVRNVLSANLGRNGSQLNGEASQHLCARPKLL